MTDPAIAAWSRESDLLFALRQLREENELLKTQREWQGLTDKEMMQCYDDVDWDSDQDVWLDFGENVQVKLKEKNT